MGTKDTTGSIEIYPSMAVLKRDYSKFEQDYYDMVARFGKKSRVGESRRGQIDHFSKSARYRMLKKLGSIGSEDPPFIVTLGTWNIFFALVIFSTGSQSIRSSDIEIYAPLLHFWGERINLGGFVFTY